MIKIGGIEFDHHSYDEEADVLYLSVGEPQVPAETDATPEGHAVDFDADGNVIGMIIVNLRFLLERDGELKVAWPEAHVPPEEFSAALRAAAQPRLLLSSSSSRGRGNRHVNPVARGVGGAARHRDQCV